MKKILIGILIAFSMITTSLPVYAEQNIENIYDAELENAIISGSGTEDDPYIVDYEKAPNFEEYVVNVYEEARGKNYTRATGFTGYVLTTYKGSYSNGAVWVYQSGGLSVNADGNLRVQKVSYISNEDANRIVAAMSVPTTWEKIKTTIGVLAGAKAIEIITKISNSIPNVGGHSPKSIGRAVAVFLLAVANYGASGEFIRSLINNSVNSGLYSAVNNGTSCVNILYLSSYHGAWYQNKTSEGGWSGDAVYIPSSTYGTGTFVAN